MSIRRRVPKSARPAARKALSTVGAVTRRWRSSPTFVVIGGQRCGTTTIFTSLAQHPQILRPPVDKGTDYYTLHYDRGLDWYRSRMPLEATVRRRHARYGDAQVFEACTYYMFHPYAIARLAEDWPDIKLVAMLRDPVERAFSAYKHEVARGFDTEPDFLHALQLEGERLSGEYERMQRDIAYESFSHRHHAYLSRGRYAEQLERVYSHFDRDQVHVMQSETFFAAPDEEFAGLLKFLGVSAWQPRRGFEQRNSRPSAAMPTDAREFLTDYYRPHNEALADLLGCALPWPGVGSSSG